MRIRNLIAVPAADPGGTPASGGTSNPITDLSHRYGISLPAWALTILTLLAFIIALAAILKPLAGVPKAVAAIVRFVLRRQDLEAEHRAERWRGYARAVETQLHTLALREEWQDERFTELEAEVEIEGRERIARWLRWSPTRTLRRRRVSSLSTALRRSTERLVVLEGEPGAGKSVALRHLALHLAREASRTRDPELIPLYVNLKEFQPTSHPVRSDDVHDFILDSLKRAGDRRDAIFLDDFFDQGLTQGNWLLILDSFDEIPAILSAVEADAVVKEYAAAVYSFLHLNTCRGIIASREFRGPRTLHLPRFHVMPLTSRQQGELVRRFGLRPELRRSFRDEMAVADIGIRQMASNPMFLSLVCSYVQDNGRFPANPHAAFESYLDQRLTNDAGRIKTRFGMDGAAVRDIAELVAYSMTAHPGVGLSPTRQALRELLPGVQKLDVGLDALEFSRLGRRSLDGTLDQVQFSFAHRRFQEYFATCVVLKVPDLVPPGQLLLNGRWRETVVTLLQTQPLAAIEPILRLMSEILDEIADLNDEDGSFVWGLGTLHVLEILAVGMANRLEEIPAKLRSTVSRITGMAWDKGRRYDRVWVTRVVITAEPAVAEDQLRRAFESGSSVLRDVAYTTASRFAEPSERLLRGIRETLVQSARDGRLRRNRIEVNAEVRRLPRPEGVLRTFRLLNATPVAGVLVALAYPAAVLAAVPGRWPYVALLSILAVAMEWANIATVLKLKVHVPSRLRYLQLQCAPSDQREAVRTLAAQFAARMPLVPISIFAMGQHLGPTRSAVVFGFGMLFMMFPMYWLMVTEHAISHGCAGFWETLAGGVILHRHVEKNSIRDLVKSIRRSLNWRRYNWRRLIRDTALSIALALMSTGPLILGYALWHTTFRWVAIVIGSAYALAFIAAIAQSTWQWLHGRRQIRRFLRTIRDSSEPLLPIPVLMTIANLPQESDVIQFIRILRSHPELRGDGVVAALIDLATLADKTERSGGQKFVGELVYDWPEADPAGFERALRKTTNGVIDQISLLADDERSAEAWKAVVK